MAIPRLSATDAAARANSRRGASTSAEMRVKAPTYTAPPISPVLPALNPGVYFRRNVTLEGLSTLLATHKSSQLCMLVNKVQSSCDLN